MGTKSKAATEGEASGNGGGVSYPGVFIEEVPSANKPIEGVGTSVAAFVGLAPDAPGVMWRRTGAVLVLVAGVAAGVWVWRRRAARRRDPEA